jgi:hypothetical protein
MGESTISRLVGSLAAAIVILLLAAWLHGATFASFRQGAEPGIAASLRTALKHLLPVLVVVLGAIAIYAFLAWWSGYSIRPASQLASWMTFHFRKPVRPATVLRYFNAVLWMVRWVLLPADLLPLLSGVASRGWPGLGEFGWRRYSRLYRLEVPVLVMCALWLPLWLINWVPSNSGFTIEMVSFICRSLVAYLLFVMSALLLAYLTSREKPAANEL